MENKKFDVHKLVGVGIFTAIVAVLEWVSAAVGHVGIFTFTLALVPIVVGAALYGPKAGAWLGFVFGVVVLLSGDATAFWVVNVLGTIVTVLVKGTLAGWLAGVVFKLLEKKNTVVAAMAAALIAPVANTGTFLLGCLLFFLPTINEWAAAAGMASAGRFMIFGLVGVNFLVEIAISIVLGPTILRLIKIGQRSFV